MDKARSYRSANMMAPFNVSEDTIRRCEPRAKGVRPAQNDAAGFTAPFRPPRGGVPVVTHLAGAECPVSQRPLAGSRRSNVGNPAPSETFCCAGNGGSGSNPVIQPLLAPLARC